MEASAGPDAILVAGGAVGAATEGVGRQRRDVDGPDLVRALHWLTNPADRGASEMLL